MYVAVGLWIVYNGHSVSFGHVQRTVGWIQWTSIVPIPDFRVCPSWTYAMDTCLVALWVCLFRWTQWTHCTQCASIWFLSAMSILVNWHNEHSCPFNGHTHKSRVHWICTLVCILPMDTNGHAIRHYVRLMDDSNGHVFNGHLSCEMWVCPLDMSIVSIYQNGHNRQTPENLQWTQ